MGSSSRAAVSWCWDGSRPCRPATGTRCCPHAGALPAAAPGTGCPGLTRRKHDRQRAAVPVGQGMNLGAQPAAGASQRVIERLISEILVIRQCPLCGHRAARQPSADGHGRCSSRPRAGSAAARHARARRPARPRTSAHRCRHLTTAGDAPKLTATHRNNPVGHATGSPCDNARWSPPASTGDNSTVSPDAHRQATPARSTPTTHQRSHPHAASDQPRSSTAKPLADTLQPDRLARRATALPATD